MRLTFCIIVTLCLLTLIAIARRVVSIQPTVEKVVGRIAVAFDLDNALGEWGEFVEIYTHGCNVDFDRSITFPV